MMIKELTDPKFKEIKDLYSVKILEFITLNNQVILTQLKEDKDYQNQMSELPRIPIFDNFLSNLESKIRKSLSEEGYFNGSADRMIAYYTDVFYYSSLPNLSLNSKNY